MNKGCQACDFKLIRCSQASWINDISTNTRRHSTVNSPVGRPLSRPPEAFNGCLHLTGRNKRPWAASDVQDTPLQYKVGERKPKPQTSLLVEWSNTGTSCPERFSKEVFPQMKLVNNSTGISYLGATTSPFLKEHGLLPSKLQWQSAALTQSSQEQIWWSIK